MKEFDRLLEIVAALRAPEGCPWDREQTIDSLEPFVLEETYEVLQAIDRHDHALLRAFHIGARAASVGFDWAGAGAIVDKIQEEVDELRDVVEAHGAVDQGRAEEEMGDLLFSIANLSRKLGIEPETALRKANDKFTRRFGVLEVSVADSGRAMKDMALEEL